MDYIEGETLETYLDKVGGKLPLEKALSIGLQLRSVLDYLHNRQPPIIFRDLKPANVMFAPAGHIYLIDFGIARHFKPGQSKDTAALGSSGYAAPEQYGKMQTTPRTDIYTLGATLHQLISGNDPSDTPFHFAPLQLHHHPVLVELEALIMQMLEVDISKRPASIAEVKQKLQVITTIYTAAQTHPLPSTLPPGYRAVGAATGNSPTSGGSFAPAASGQQGANVSTPASRSKQVNLPQPQKNTLYICSGHTSRVTAVGRAPAASPLGSARHRKKIIPWGGKRGEGLRIFFRHTHPGNNPGCVPDREINPSSPDGG